MTDPVDDCLAILAEIQRIQERKDAAFARGMQEMADGLAKVERNFERAEQAAK